jgi:hypothetical protein
MGKVCEKIRQGLPVEAGALYAVTVMCVIHRVRYYAKKVDKKYS